MAAQIRQQSAPVWPATYWPRTNALLNGLQRRVGYECCRRHGFDAVRTLKLPVNMGKVGHMLSVSACLPCSCH